MKKKGKPEKPLPGVVHLPRWVQTVGRRACGVCLALALGLVWLWPVAGAVFALLALGFGLLARSYRIWCVLYDESGFETVDALGRSRHYGYGDIRGICGHRLSLKDRTLRLGKRAVGRMEFLNEANRQYRLLHGNRPIPLLPRRKVPDIFRGNVVKPWTYLTVYGIFAGLLLCVLLLAWWGEQPVSPEDAEYFELTFTNARLEWGNLWMDSPADKTPFYLAAWTGRTENLAGRCDGRTVFYVYSDYVSYSARSHTPARNVIYSLTGADGTEYLTFAETNAHQARVRAGVCGIFGGLLALWLCYVGLALYVGRHPERFKPKTVYRFFKKETIYWKGCH